MYWNQTFEASNVRVRYIVFGFGLCMPTLDYVHVETTRTQWALAVGSGRVGSGLIMNGFSLMHPSHGDWRPGIELLFYFAVGLVTIA